MICESCGKNPATVHLTEIQQGEKKEIHICEACAEKKGVSTMNPPLSVPDILGGLMEPPVGSEIKELLEQKCPYCGITYPEFRMRGRLGCPEDYRVFAKGLEPLLDKIHGSTQHIGKIPSNAGKDVARQKTLRKLRHDLERAIRLEAYERAAKIRDEIHALEGETPRARNDADDD
jgi:protein arginine kinase activator